MIHNNKKKRASIISGIVAAFLLMAMVFAPTSNVQRNGPFFMTANSFDSATSGQFGGQANVFLAADSVRIGQIVYLSAKNSVKVSATFADYNAVQGVVVGGTRTSMLASTSRADTSTLAATLGQRVLVLRRGRTCVLDSTGAITSGTQVRASGTAGRMAARTTAIDTFNRIIGKTIDTTITGTCGMVDVNIR